jgi:aryl-alcohol dehydrogenase-like predicted oxidoreductase
VLKPVRRLRQSRRRRAEPATQVTVPNLALNSGYTIPQLGFGVFKIVPGETAGAVREALRVGYRHIDTAEMYRNETGVGEAFRDSGLDRSEVFITSKLNNGFHRRDDARRAFDGTLEALGSDYVDLFLIHWPLPTLYGGDFVSTWLTLTEFYRDGRARSIGVSNFQVAHLRRLVQQSDVVPAVNQIEVHPNLCNEEVRAERRTWNRHGGVVAACERQGSQRSGDRRDRQSDWKDPCAGRASLARSTRECHLPQVDDTGTDQGELPDLRLRARAQ